MIAVACNRRGFWARSDTTPFGYGQPFSKRQLAALLRETLFSPERFGEALYVPPFERRFFLRLAPAFERTGKRMSLPGAGVHLVEATKQLYRPVMLRGRVLNRAAIPRLEPRLSGSFRVGEEASSIDRGLTSTIAVHPHLSLRQRRQEHHARSSHCRLGGERCWTRT